jgi:hypothetical protein
MFNPENGCWKATEGSVDLFINSEGLACSNATIQDYKFAGGTREGEGEGGRGRE